MKAIYLDIDTLRRDRLGCYGYPHQITPNLDRLASEGIVFKNVFAANTPCMPARASVLTGKFGISNGVETHGPRSLSVNCAPRSMLPYVLSLSGIYTAAISSFGRHPAPWFFNGWREVIDPSLIDNTHFQAVLAERINEAALAWIARNKEKDFFLYLHYWDPHLPMNAPEEYIRRIGYQPDTSHITDEEIQNLAASDKYRGGRHARIANREKLAKLLAQYEAEILYVDAQAGEIIDYLKKIGIYEETLLIVSSDHGEQFGEACMYQEHGTVHDSCIRIPLMIKTPDMEMRAKEIDSFVYSLDIAPTICEFFGVQASPGWHGQSLMSLLAEEKGRLRDYVVCDHGLYTCQRAVRERKWKLVITYHPGIWDFPEIQLFDLENDPYEKVNVAGDFKDQVKRLRACEKEWVERYRADGEDMLVKTARQGPHAYDRCKAFRNDVKNP